MKILFARKVVLVLGSWLAFSALAADEWDPSDDTAASTRNEVTRVDWQRHDLEARGGVADEDWFIYFPTAGRTFQVLVTQIAGDVPYANPDFLQIFAADGSTLLFGTAATGQHFARIRWQAANSNAVFVRVKGNANTPASARYSIVFTETTLYCPRYNNSGSQVSVLIVQNVSGGACQVAANFFDEAGSVVGSQSQNIAASALWVLPTASVPNVAGTKGSIQIGNAFCSPSALKAKAVALEPATGFSFDTPCERRQ